MKKKTLADAITAACRAPHLFLDLDGTLVGSSGDVRDDVWEALEPLRGHVGISVCTGRTRAGVAQRIAARLDDVGLHIFENGGLIAPAAGEPLFVSELPAPDLARIIEASRRIDATVELYTADGIFVSRLSDDCRAHARALDIEIVEADLERVAREHAVIRAHWIMRENTVPAVLDIPLTDCELGLASSPVLPDLVFASVTRRGTSKGHAAAIVAEAADFQLADAVGIGDAIGDLPLLEAVGHPFIVENASLELIERYTALGHVDSDGIVPLLLRMATPIDL